MANYAFIDSQNLNLAIKTQGWTLSYRKFRRYLSDKYKIDKAFMFIGYLPGNETLYKTLQDEGFLIVFKPTLKLPSGKVKGNVDAELVLHAMIEYRKYDKALIVTNDGDFHCLVERLVKKDKLLKLMTPDRNSYSSLLRKFRPHIVYMNDLKKKLEYKKSTHKKSKKKLEPKKSKHRKNRKRIKPKKYKYKNINIKREGVTFGRNLRCALSS